VEGRTGGTRCSRVHSHVDWLGFIEEFSAHHPEERRLLRYGLLALQVALGAGCVWFTYSAVAALVTSSPAVEAPIPPAVGGALTKRPLEEYAVIATRNLFGTLTSVEVAAPETEAIAESTLQVKLIGTLAAGAGGVSVASIEDPSGKRIPVRTNDVLPGGAKVVRIEPTRIVIDNRGRLEEITFPEKTGTPNVPSTPANDSLLRRRPGLARQLSQPQPQSLSERLRRLNESVQQQQAQPVPAPGSPPASGAVAAAGQQPGSLLDQVRMLPAYDVSGALQGLKVSWVQEGSGIATNGVQVGDLITSVNGVAITSPSEGLRAFREVPAGSTVLIDLQRNGAPVSVAVDVGGS
jgi:type II secretion system protein C